MPNKVVDKDRGRRDLMRRLRKTGKSFVKVGIFGNDASEPHAGSNKSNVEIAGFHEFGTNTIPQRSYLRATVDAEETRIKNLQRKIARGIIKRRITEEKGLALIGEFLVGKMQKRIQGGIPPKLKPATIRRKTVQGKKGTTPVIDTGQVVQSITWAIEKGKLRAA